MYYSLAVHPAKKKKKMERIKREYCSVVLLIALASIHKLLPIQLCDARVLDFIDDEIGQSDGT